MTPTGGKNTSESSSPAGQPVSVHRAFVYSAGAPGLGEFYAGSRLRGIVTAGLFVVFTVGLARILFAILSAMMNQIFGSLSGAAPSVAPQVPLFSMGVCFFGLYFTWLWAMISAVDAAAAQRQRDGGPPQASVAWAAATSWFCPGAGQVYTGSRRYGYLVFAAYLLGLLAMVPAYIQLFHSISDLAGSRELSPYNPMAVIDIVHKLVARVNLSFGKLCQASVKYIAVAGTLVALRQGPLEADMRWSKPSAAYGAALFGLGWLCPGAGQILQKRFTPGWYFLGAYIVSTFFIGFLLHLNLITVPTADLLGWLPVAIKLIAMIEAPLRMLRQAQMKKGRSDLDLP
jgi:TM2 domain-containing membrane protein YozV